MPPKGTLITIGSFDGVHKGHQALLERTVLEAKRRNLVPMAMTFEVPPRLLLQKSTAPSVLSTSEEKERLLKSYGMKRVELLQFGPAFSKQKPFYFFKYVLLAGYRARGLVVGLDFRFGADRSAGAHELVKWGGEFGIPVWVIPQVMHAGEPVSSSRLRALLAQGKYPQSLRLMNHPYSIVGPVVKGRGVGRRLGVPTFNIQTGSQKVLPQGVYVAKATPFSPLKKGGYREQSPFFGVCNIGHRPTFLKKSPVVLEFHGLGAGIPARPAMLSVMLLKRLRDEKKFSSRTGLMQAISSDIQKAKRIIAKIKKDLHSRGNSI